ncbi:hypothetical protein K523DRAFT_319664 [Schizophyllum commune Tattone D]|nr:hypothetical protein K523DRAFT_319664 [Schizophyllum commune Tattone D]
MSRGQGRASRTRDSNKQDEHRPSPERAQAQEDGMSPRAPRTAASEPNHRAQD